MPNLTGKTVYILGAGASFHTGAPLLNNFLVASRMLSETNRNLIYKDAFDRTFAWMNELKSSSYYIDFNLDNLEHLFSLADMERQIGLVKGEQHFSDLKFIILETLDNSCKLKMVKGKALADDIYDRFITSILLANEDRRKLLQQSDNEFRKDVIITFNYDVMLDHSMNVRRVLQNYCFNKTDALANNEIKLLKLHGSTNWAICKNCNNSEPQIIPAFPLAEGYKFNDPYGIDTVPFRMFTEVMKKTPCQKCSEEGVLEPILIPPTWSKSIEKHLLSKIWSAAVEEIIDAFQIIVIGYSMPSTDTFFQYLLTLGLSFNSKLHRVIIVDINDSNSLRNRYEMVFSRSLKEKGRLIFLNGMSFENFVKGPKFNYYNRNL